MNKLDAKMVWLLFLSYIFRWSFFVLILSLGIAGSLSDLESEGEFSLTFLNWLWLFIPLFLISAFVWAKLTYYYYRYELTEMGFRKESGVIYKKYVTIPYDRIQNVDIYRGILARLLGLSDLNIQTAGASTTMNRYGAWGAGAEGRLPGLSKEVAEQLRDELVQRAKHSRTQGI